LEHGSDLVVAPSVDRFGVANVAEECLRFDCGAGTPPLDRQRAG
jgi:hypothetical protein